MTTLFGVYGASGCGRTVMPFLRDAYGMADAEFVFIDDAPQKPAVNGHAVLTWERFLTSPLDKQVCVAIANAAVRQAISEKCQTAGVKLATCVSRLANVLDDVQVGEGAIVSAFATIGSNVIAGQGLLADIYSCVNHDCILGDFVTLAPYANCNGNVVIGDHAYIGSGALIRQGKAEKPLIIGKGAVIGMGAVVTRDVPAGQTVVGNPARLLVKG